jgi:CheY-like chemotaxis protein
MQAPSPPEPSGRVLVVDDNLDAAETLAELLSITLDSEIDIAYSGKTAIDAARAHRPSAVISDIEMPQMDGMEVAAVILALYPDAPPFLVALTGHADLNHAGMHVFDRCFHKPFDLKAIVAELHAAGIR